MSTPIYSSLQRRCTQRILSRSSGNYLAPLTQSRCASQLHETPAFQKMMKDQKAARHPRILGLYLVLNPETTERLNNVRKSIHEMLPEDRREIRENTGIRLFGTIPAEHKDLVLRYLKEVASKTHPFAVGEAEPGVVSKKFRYNHKVVMTHMKASILQDMYRDMVAQWKGKMDMIETRFENWEWRPEVPLQINLEHQIAKKAAAKLQESKRGGVLDLGTAEGLVLVGWPRTTDASYDYSTVIQKFPFKNVNWSDAKVEA